MSIPLPRLLREHRLRSHRDGLTGSIARRLLALWVSVAARPRLYRVLVDRKSRLLKRLAGRRGYLRRVPLVGGWAGSRDLPAPQGGSFVAEWQRRRVGRRKPGKQ